MTFIFPIVFSFKNNTSFVTRFNTLRRGRASHHSSTGSKLTTAMNNSNDNLSNPGSENPHGPNPGGLSREASITKKGSDGKQPIVHDNNLIR